MHNKLSPLHSFKVVVCFLEYFYNKTSSDDLGSLLGDIQLFEDGSGTWDPAAWYDWIDALENKKLISPFEAFVAMFNFLNAYHKRTSSASMDIQELLNDMKTYKKQKFVNSAIWQIWINCIKNIMKE